MRFLTKTGLFFVLISSFFPGSQITEKVFKFKSLHLRIADIGSVTIWEEKMSSIKLVGCIVALIVLIAFIAPVSAEPYFGYSQVGSKYSGNQVSLSSSLGSSTVGTSGSPYLGYSFAVKGVGTKPTLGDVSAFSNYFSQTAGQRFSYSESSSASGKIYSFSKIISVVL
jgi:hypothetical protein